MAKKLYTRPYDAAVYLKTEQDCALYMQAAIDESEGDPALVSRRSVTSPARAA